MRTSLYNGKHPNFARPVPMLEGNSGQFDKHLML